MGERMAGPLLKGGRLYLEPVGRYWGSEFHCRAGGFMSLHRQGAGRMRRKDVAYFELPRADRRGPGDEQLLRRLVRGPAHLFAIGRREDAEGIAPASRFEGFSGAAARPGGAYHLPGYGPLVNTDLLERIVRGWIVAGELVAACTRARRMPILFMSNWFEGSDERNAAFCPGYEAGRRMAGSFFHKEWKRERTTIYVPPLAAGYVGASFLDVVERIRASLAAQGAELSRAGVLLADAKRRGRRICSSAPGHMYPHALNIPDGCDYPVHWTTPTASLPGSVPRSWRRGDAVIHFGYGPTHPAEVQRLLKRGFSVVQTSPYGRPADLPDRTQHVWFDLPWRPGDAEVYIPGYSVRVVPGSSSAQTMGYFCLLAELAHRMQQITA